MSVPFLGDYNTTETVHIPFNTFSSNDPSASVTVTDLAAGDIEIHKDGSTTQRASDSGVTVSIDFDSVTGNHLISIDLSDNTDAGFYADGSRYLVRVEGITVDSGTLNAWVGGFSIGCTLRPTTAGRTLDVSATGETGLDFSNIKDATGAHTLTNITVPTVTSVGTCTTNSDMRGTDSAYTGTPPTVGDIADAVWDEAIADHATGTSFGAKNQKAVPSETIGDYKATSVTVSDKTGFSLAADQSGVTIGTVTTNTDMRGTDGANTTTPDAAGTAATLLSDMATATNQGTLATAISGIPAGVWAVGTRTLTSFGTLVADIATAVWGAAARTLTAFAFTPSLDAAYDAAKTAAQASTALDNTTWTDAKAAFLDAAVSGATAPTAAAVADAVWDEALAGHAVAGSTGAAMSAAGTAGDPWITALPGAYAAGTAGYLIGNMAQLGAGAITWTYTLTNSVTGAPIDGAAIWVSTDSAGANIIASGTTDDSGVVTFYLDAGTVYIWRSKAGYNFDNPDQETVA